MDAGLSMLSRKLIAAGKMKTCTDEYSALKSDEERFSYSLRLIDEYKVEPKIHIREKSATKSELYRKAGNDLFISPKVDELRDSILENYTKSIAYAEPNSQHLALAYGNRSALLFRSKLYDHCLMDIERALALDYPPHLKVKLATRRVFCLLVLKTTSINEINQKIDEARRYLDELSFDDPIRSKFNEILKNPEKSLDFGPQRLLFDEKKYKPCIPKDNPEISGASSALKICYNEEFGRHVVATRKIEPGEVLCVQKGYATILAPERFYTHCSNCLSQVWSAVPCNNCPLVVFCNETCRDEAWRNYHDIECGVIDAMINLELNLMAMISLRLAVRAVKDAGGFESLKKRIETLDSWTDPRTKGFIGIPPVLVEKDYLSVYTLAKNTEKRSCPDLFGRSFSAVFIVYCIATISNFLGEKLPQDSKAILNHPWSVFLGGLITAHQQIIPSNVHGVDETIGNSSRERGASLIPFLSFFNHSCDSDVTRHHYGTDVVVNALKPIKPGEQIFDNYGMLYAVTDRTTRRKKLKKQFYFDCHCSACVEDWSTYDGALSCNTQTMNPTIKKEIAETLVKFNRCVKLVKDHVIQENQDIIIDLEDVLKILYENVQLPCKEINEAVETLKRLYSLLSNRWQSLTE